MGCLGVHPVPRSAAPVAPTGKPANLSRRAGPQHRLEPQLPGRWSREPAAMWGLQQACSGGAWGAGLGSLGRPPACGQDLYLRAHQGGRPLGLLPQAALRKELRGAGP